MLASTNAVGRRTGDGGGSGSGSSGSGSGSGSGAQAHPRPWDVVRGDRRKVKKPVRPDLPSAQTQLHGAADSDFKTVVRRATAAAAAAPAPNGAPPPQHPGKPHAQPSLLASPYPHVAAPRTLSSGSMAEPVVIPGGGRAAGNVVSEDAKKAEEEDGDTDDHYRYHRDGDGNDSSGDSVDSSPRHAVVVGKTVLQQSSGEGARGLHVGEGAAGTRDTPWRGSCAGLHCPHPAPSTAPSAPRWHCQRSSPQHSPPCRWRPSGR